MIKQFEIFKIWYEKNGGFISYFSCIFAISLILSIALNCTLINEGNEDVQNLRNIITFLQTYKDFHLKIAF